MARPPRRQRHDLGVLPEARYQLRDWEHRWALPLLTRLRLAWQRWPDNARLDEVVQEVRAQPGVAPLWDSPTPAEPSPPGDVRPMYFPWSPPTPSTSASWPAARTTT
ncbi:hypothetical protein [Streptomyces sp. G45]|uniref:MmyB family transcriptional regulator n=1 Tax=Streptomyces sp. G45 TaxID=3406627 RepID=UPI003C144659